MDSEKEVSLSIFTPTYNRAHLLKRLASSIKNQDRLIAEWIVVDDGSTDNTREVLDCMRADMPFKIIYKYNKNMGISHSHNIGMSLVSSDFFFKIDSDDYLLPGAISHITESIEAVKKASSKDQVYAYSFACVDPSGNLQNNLSVLGEHGKKFSENLFLGKYSIMRISGLLKGDLLDVFPSSPVLEQYRFPIYSNENYTPTGYISYFLADYFNTYVAYSNQPVLVKDYQKDGLTLTNSDSLTRLPRAFLSGVLLESLIAREDFIAWLYSMKRLLQTIFVIIIREVKFWLDCLIKDIKKRFKNKY